MNGMYGLDPQKMVMNEMPSENISTIIHIELSDVMRAYAEGLFSAFQMGQSARKNMADETIISSSETASFPRQKFIGIYDNSGYGVYRNLQKLEESKPYWKAELARYSEFSSYEEALDFAKNGVAAYMKVPIHTIPNPQHPIDWRQSVHQVSYGNSSQK